MANPEYVSFDEAEVPLLRVALADPNIANTQAITVLMDGGELTNDIKHALDCGEVFKQLSNGWIYFIFPNNSDTPGDNRAQVWSGHSPYLRERNISSNDTLLISLQPGIIAESSMHIRVHDRLASAHETKIPYGRVDPNLDARGLLLSGIEWFITQTEALRAL